MALTSQCILTLLAISVALGSKCGPGQATADFSEMCILCNVTRPECDTNVAYCHTRMITHPQVMCSTCNRICLCY